MLYCSYIFESYPKRHIPLRLYPSDVEYPGTFKIGKPKSCVLINICGPLG